MKKTELIRAIVELVSVGILKSADGYRIIEQIIVSNKFGVNVQEAQEVPLEQAEEKHG